MSRERWSSIVEGAPDPWLRAKMGNAFSKRDERGRADLPLLSVTADQGVILRDEVGRRDTSAKDKSRYLTVRGGDIVYNTMRMWQGVSGRSDFEGITSPAYTVCRPIEGRIDSLFASYLLKHPALIREFRSKSQGIVDDTLSLKFPAFAKIDIALPPLAEQRRITEILSSVDEAIQTTQAVIEQTRRVLDGTLRVLFIGADLSENRKPCGDDWRVGRYADSIPSSWNLTRLTDVAKLESGHTPSKRCPEYWDGDVNWLSLHDTKLLSRRVVYETTQKTTPLGVKHSSARILPAGTVAFSRTASVGHCVIMGKSMATSQDFANYVCGPKIDNRFLMHLFRWMAPIWGRLASGSTHKTVYMPVFEELRIALPPIPEQRKIAAIADSFFDEIEACEALVTKAMTLKTALMSDLLTGRKRVTSDLPLAAE